MPSLLETRLAGARVAVDVQHLYRPAPHARDQGAVYRLPDGSTVSEASRVLVYAQALCAWLRARGATVLTNDPSAGRLCGPYAARNRFARDARVDAYLACHLNAGGGGYGAVEYLFSAAAFNLAQRICGELTAALSIPARPIDLQAGARGRVCVEAFGIERPALILEPFFGDYPPHQKLLSAPNLVLVGEAIGRGFGDWWQFARAKAPPSP